MPERVRVLARVRPVLPSDPPGTCFNLPITDKNHVTILPKGHIFRLDGAYDAQSTTEVIFDENVKEIVDSFLSGYNATVIAYGPTGTGKTYTMSALTPMIMEHIVEKMNHSTLSLSFQYLEVYGEALRDLLASDPVSSAKNIQLYDNQPNTAEDKPDRSQGTGVFVGGAMRVKARDMSEINDIIEYGSRSRATAETLVNEASSRSHSIFTIFNHDARSKLHLVDLAGSERYKKTQNVGLRFQESIAINGGLLALGNVIRALGSHHYPRSQKNHKGSSIAHVPYRSSKLTRLLQDSLGGHSKTLFIACIAPGETNREESIRTLQYCALASRIQNDPVLQQSYTPSMQHIVANDPSGMDDTVRKLLEEVEQLQEKVRIFEEREISYKNSFSVMEAEKEYLVRYNKDLSDRLKRSEEELRKDETMFSKQIIDIQHLIRENEELKRLPAHYNANPFSYSSQPGVRYNHSISDIGVQTDQTLQSPSTPQSSLGPCSSNKTPLSQSPVLLGTPSIKEIGNGPINSKILTPVTQNPAFVSIENGRNTFPVSPYTPEFRRGSGARALVYKDKDENSYHGRFAIDETSLLEKDNQLHSLAMEALLYQNHNAELRSKLRSVLAMQQSQYREAAFMQQELQAIDQLLKSPLR